MDRRDFLLGSALLAAAAALAACAGAGGSVTWPQLTQPGTIKVSDYSSLANIGGVAMVTVQTVPMAIIRLGANSFAALSRVCPHEGGIVGQSGNGFLCPTHGATFTIDGTWTGGQLTTNLKSYTTSYDATTGMLTIS